MRTRHLPSTAAPGLSAVSPFEDVAATGDDGYPNTRYAWFVVICLMLAYSVALIDRQILALLVQPVRRDLALTDTQFSLLVGFAFVFFYSTMGLFCGRLADTVNRRNLIILGMIMWCIATAACGLAQSFGELLAARMMVGVGEAVLNPAAYSMIADYFPKERRSRAAATYSMAISLGNGSSLLFGAATVAAFGQRNVINVPVLGDVRSWQAVFLLIGLPGLLIAALMLAVREPIRREVTGAGGTFRDAVAFFRRKSVTLSLIIIPFALNGLVTYCVATWTPSTFIRTFGWTVPQIATTQGLILLTFGSSGILTAGWWVSRKGRALSNAVVLTTARNAMMLMPLFALLIGFAPSPYLALVGVAGIAFTGGFPSALAAMAIIYTTPNQFRGQVTSVYIMLGTLVGFGFGVTLVALITDYVFQNELMIGRSLSLVVCGATVIAATMLHFAGRRPDKDHLA